MEGLFMKAREFGRVCLFTQDDGTYTCNIEFNTINHVELKAHSGYNHSTPEAAIQAAIDKAKEIVNSLVAGADQLRRLTKY